MTARRGTTPVALLRKPVRCDHCGRPKSPLSMYMVAGKRVCYEAARRAAETGRAIR